MKEAIRIVIMHFFIITVGVLFFTGIINTFDGNTMFSPQYPWEVILTGVIGSVPSFLFYSKKEPTKKQFTVRVIIHFIVITALIMGEGALLGWYGSLIDVIVIFFIILAIYAFVWFYMYRTNLKTANKINSVLKQMNKDEID